MSKPLDVGAPGNSKPLQLVPPPSLEPSAVPTKKTLINRWTIGAVGTLVVLAIIASAWWAFSGNATVHYATAPVTTGPIIRTVTATGTVNPELTIIVGSYVSGVIQELTCDYNTRVKRGQSCAKIDARPYQTIVDQGKANLAVAIAQLQKDKASLTYAKASYERAEVLVRTNAVSKDALDVAYSTYEQALAQISFDEATIQQRQAVLDAAQVNLDYTNITSPVDGTVVSRNVTMGQTVAASFQTPTLFLIATDLTKMQVDANVSESDIGGIKQGNRATFTVDAYSKRIFEGRVTQVRQSQQTVQNVVTYDIVISVDNIDLALKPGLTAATAITIDRRDNVLRIPNQALRFVPSGTTMGRSDQAQIWLLRNGQPELVRVTTGLDDEAYTEIVQGNLKADDQVITAEQRNAASARSAVPRPRL